ncbi:MAG: hypothetical protein KC609_03795, partial [Myxococcales bacterium]|nr:hypothetical protein [Myxococcales bacterium]
MKKSSKWKSFGTVAMAVFCLLYVLPSFFEEQLPVWYTNMFKSRISYGLDIKGGLELEYTVDWKKAVLDYCVKNSEGITDRFLELWTKKRIDEISDAERTKLRPRLTIEPMRPFSRGKLRLIFTNKDDAKLFGNQWLKDKNINDFGVSSTDETGTNTIVEVKLLDSKIAEIKKQAVKQTLEIIRKRAEGFGLAEPDVRQSGDSNIVVQLPGLKKSQMKQVKEQMGRPARLMFRIVEEKLDVVKKIGETYLPQYKKLYPTGSRSLRYVESDRESGDTYIRSDSKVELARFIRWMSDQRAGKRPVIPSDRMLAMQKVQRRNETNQVTTVFYRTWYLLSKIQLDGKHVTKANVYYDKDNKAYVSLDLDSVGGRTFQRVTRKYVKRLLAIMLDDDLESAPQIREEIGGGRVRIDLGGVNAQEVLQDAQNLVVVLTHGAYKAPVYKVSENEVGPQLGQDAINEGKLALMVGGALVLL